MPALPIQFGAERPGVRSDLPAPGQHTREVLEALLGARLAGDGGDTAAAPSGEAREHPPAGASR